MEIILTTHAITKKKKNNLRTKDREFQLHYFSRVMIRTNHMLN